MPKKGGLEQFADLTRGGLGKKEGGGVFEGVDTPTHTMACSESPQWGSGLLGTYETLESIYNERL